jgi:hypothetical protein
MAAPQFEEIDIHPTSFASRLRRAVRIIFYINRGAEDKMNGGRLVKEEPWLPEQITRRSRLSAVRALVAWLAVAAACIRVPEG